MTLVPLRLMSVVLLAIVALIATGASSKAAFPGENGRIAYERKGLEGSFSIWSMNPDGSFRTQLTEGPDDHRPSYSPDGSRIVFERGPGIALMNADGSGQRQKIVGERETTVDLRDWIEDYSPSAPMVKVERTTTIEHSFGDPAFSPDSGLVVVEREGEEIVETICEVEAEGSTECLYEGHNLVHYERECNECRSRLALVDSGPITVGAIEGGVAMSPGWRFSSPTFSVGGLLAYAMKEGDESWVHLDYPWGNPQLTLVKGFDPDFSPDGTRIVYSTGGGLGVVGLDGQALPAPRFPASRWDLSNDNPVFSPDGTSFALHTFSANIIPFDYIYLGDSISTVGASEGDPVYATNRAFAPSWQPLPRISPPQPATRAKAQPRKGTIAIGRRHRVKVARIACGSSACTLQPLLAILKAGGKKCVGKILAPKRIPAGQSRAVSVRFGSRCWQRLREAGRGVGVTRILVKDDLGARVLRFRSIFR